MSGLRRCGVLAAAGSVLVAGCTATHDKDNDNDDGARTRPSASRSAETGRGDAPATAGSQQRLTDPARYPRTPAEGRDVVGRLIPGPALFGADVTRAVPYESRPGSWADLDEECVWQLREPPEDVLATRTRYFWLPAEKGGGKGAVRLTTTVTVHRTALDAAWEQAGMLEEALGCEEQVLRPGERLTNLFSSAFGLGEGGNVDVDDSLLENGLCHSETRGGPYPYFWQQATLGPVVLSASACGGRGRTKDEVQGLVQEPLAQLMVRAEREIGPEAGTDEERGTEPEPGTKGDS
ncbi:hypothetical protein [Streptomyces sp. MMBL 11-3]|uniref:hypothetical protein n=1 Tax=Streptomyces sp. MMBL 11-3 TaxID=3382639 RepID=UPI0039B3F02C